MGAEWCPKIPATIVAERDMAGSTEHAWVCCPRHLAEVFVAIPTEHICIAGGAEKCRYAVEELGFDACIDYREHPDTKTMPRH